MAGVDDPRRRSSQVDPHEQAGDELPLARLLGQRIIRQPRLLGQLDPPPAGVAESPDQHRRQQGGIHRVTHRIGHRHMQRVPLQRKVEGVTADLTRRLQPGRERELPRLAGKRAG
jgi:hypothetical protein